MTKTMAQMTTAELAALADSLRCPDGMWTPFNSVPLPRTRKALIELVESLLVPISADWSVGR